MLKIEILVNPKVHSHCNYYLSSISPKPLTSLAWSQILLGEYILLEHCVEVKHSADIYEKVEGGKNLMLTGNKWLGQSVTIINANKQYLSDGRTLQEPAAGNRCLPSCSNPTPLWVAIIVGVIPHTDRMNPAEKRVAQSSQLYHQPFLIALPTLQRRSRALAMHSNCLSPTEKFSPFSITSESSFIGSWATCVGKRQQKS